MKKLLLLAIAALLLQVDTAAAWGRTGHDAIAYIAECHLTPRARRAIERYLGHSIVYEASWMDDWRSDPEYPWGRAIHAASVDENLVYMPDKRGDVVSSLERSIEALGDYRALDDSTVVACLRSIIHFMGDMHCPGHVRYGGGKLKSYAVYFDGRKYNYHSVWDDGILQAAHRWGYIEYGHQLDRCRKEEIREICSGTLRDWFRENAETSRHIYELVAPEQHLDAREARSFFNHTHAMAERQILRAGYRLAHVLNELFG